MHVEGPAITPAEVTFASGENTLTGYLYVPDAAGPVSSRSSA